MFDENRYVAIAVIKIGCDQARQCGYLIRVPAAFRYDANHGCAFEEHEAWAGNHLARGAGIFNARWLGAAALAPALSQKRELGIGRRIVFEVIYRDSEFLSVR